MKIQATLNRSFYALTFLAFLFSSCNKDTTGSSESTNVLPTIAVAASLSASVSAAASDSVYILQPCPRGSQRNSISESVLPSTVSNYLASNYSGYTFNKAFAIISKAGTTTAYVVIVYYNDNPVGIEFDSSGNFVRVLEQRLIPTMFLKTHL